MGSDFGYWFRNLYRRVLFRGRIFRLLDLSAWKLLRLRGKLSG
jgi:hypothetical protein